MSVTVFKRKVSRSFNTRAAPFIWAAAPTILLASTLRLTWGKVGGCGTRQTGGPKTWLSSYVLGSGSNEAVRNAELHEPVPLLTRCPSGILHLRTTADSGKTFANGAPMLPRRIQTALLLAAVQLCGARVVAVPVTLAP